jgi:hypothetical protein
VPLTKILQDHRLKVEQALALVYERDVRSAIVKAFPEWSFEWSSNGLWYALYRREKRKQRYFSIRK